MHRLGVHQSPTPLENGTAFAWKMYKKPGPAPGHGSLSLPSPNMGRQRNHWKTIFYKVENAASFTSIVFLRFSLGGVVQAEFSTNRIPIGDRFQQLSQHGGTVTIFVFVSAAALLLRCKSVQTSCMLNPHGWDPQKWTEFCWPNVPWTAVDVVDILVIWYNHKI